MKANNNMAYSAHQRIRAAMAAKKAEKEKATLGKDTAEKTPEIKDMTLPQLRTFAKDNGIDLTGLNCKETIRNFILDTLKERAAAKKDGKTAEQGGEGVKTDGGEGETKPESEPAETSAAAEVENMTLPQLRTFAEDNGIDLTGLNRKDTIKNFILDTLNGKIAERDGEDKTANTEADGKAETEAAAETEAEAAADEGGTPDEPNPGTD